MDYELLTERLFEELITGNRVQARDLVSEMRDDGIATEQIAHDVLWPASEMVSELYRNDQLTNLAYHYATRLLRSLVDQAQASYAQQKRRNRNVLMFCGLSEADELESQLVADLAEADGYTITFGGGGIAADEILAEVGNRQPDVLLMFASSPTDLPGIRDLIDTVREIGAVPNLQVAVGGGVFNRAEGLAEEIGADLWATNPRELLQKLVDQKDRRATPEQRTVGRNRKETKSAAA